MAPKLLVGGQKNVKLCFLVYVSHHIGTSQLIWENPENLFLFSRITFTECRNSHPEVFLGKGVLKIRSKFTREHPCRRATSSKLQLLWNFIEIALRHGCSPVNLLHIFRTPFPRITSGRLLLKLETSYNFFVSWRNFHW